MKIVSIGKEEKVWLLGPWNSNSPIEFGYVTKPTGIVHLHEEVFDYLVIMEGKITVTVDAEEYVLKKGNIYLNVPSENALIKRSFFS